MGKYCYSLFVLLFFLSACRMEKKPETLPDTDSLGIVSREEHTVTPEAVVVPESAVAPKSRTAIYLDSLGLINVADTDSTLIIRLMYATPNNFTGQLLYKDLREAYLHPDAAKAIARAQHLLNERHTGYRLVIYDAARPLHIQQKMWDVVKGTSKSIYVSNPARGGGLHNYGVAVDVSIAGKDGQPLDMGTTVDYLGVEAHITQEASLVSRGKISEQARHNRLLLRNVMKEAGFRTLPSEWWHFNLCSRDQAKLLYKLIP